MPTIGSEMVFLTNPPPPGTWARFSTHIIPVFDREFRLLNDDGGAVLNVLFSMDRDARMDGGGPVIAACRFPKYG